MSDATRAAGPAVIEARGVGKAYRSGDTEVTALIDATFDVRRGEAVAVVGASGSGKSTLLHLLGGLDTPTAGEVILLGEPLAGLTERRRCDLRNAMLGFVYQFHHLLPELSARENVALPLRIRRQPRQQSLRMADELLAQVGLADRRQHRPGELSGGERQRVAIARALVGEPACILADEPTGNLDADNGERVFDLLLTASRTRGAAVLIVTHDTQLAQRCERVLRLTSGRLQQA